jgi:hypothetical protein
MAWSLVGTIGAVSTGAVNTAVTPAWGTGESRTAGNLLLCWVAGMSATGPDPTPATPLGWSLADKSTGTGSTGASATLFYKVAAGGDGAPTIAAGGANVLWNVQLGEFSSGGGTPALDQHGVGTTAGTSPVVATAGAVDLAGGDLIVSCGSIRYGSAGTKTITPTFNNGATATATQSGAISTTSHYGFAYGTTTGNSSADAATLTFTASGSGIADQIVASFGAIAISLVSTNASGILGNTNLSVPAPASLAPNNLLVMVIATFGGIAGTPQLPSPWQNQGATGSGTSNQMTVYTKAVVSGDTAGWQITQSSNSAILAVVLQYANVTKVDVAASFYNSGSTSVGSAAAPSLTPSGSTDLWITAFSGGLGYSISTPSGFTSEAGVAPSYILRVFDQLLSSSSATGTATSTYGAAQTGSAMSLLLTDAPQPVRVTDVVSEVLVSRPAPAMRLTELATEVLVSRPAPAMRMTQIASEVLVGRPPVVMRLTQAAAEVIVQRVPTQVTVTFHGTSSLAANVGVFHMYSRTAIFAGTSSLVASSLSIVVVHPVGSVVFAGGSSINAGLQSRKSGPVGFIPMNRNPIGLALLPPPPPSTPTAMFLGGSQLSTSTAIFLTVSPSQVGRVVLMVASESDINGTSRTVTGVTGLGVTWTRRSQNQFPAQEGQMIEVWYADIAGAVSGTITVTLNGTYDDATVMATLVSSATGSVTWDDHSSLPATVQGVGTAVVSTHSALPLVMAFAGNRGPYTVGSPTPSWLALLGSVTNAGAVLYEYAEFYSGAPGVSLAGTTVGFGTGQPATGNLTIDALRSP